MADTTKKVDSGIDGPTVVVRVVKHLCLAAMMVSLVAEFPIADCWSYQLLSVMRKVMELPVVVAVEAVVAVEIAVELEDLGNPEPCCSYYRCYTGW